MPYIKQGRKEALADGDTPKNSGELNYAFTLIANKYIEERGLKYANMNDVIGALEGAKMEFNRRVMVSYEDIKIKENGDVYTVGVK